jgi:hypothetical protein
MIRRLGYAGQIERINKRITASENAMCARMVDKTAIALVRGQYGNGIVVTDTGETLSGVIHEFDSQISIS